MCVCVCVCVCVTASVCVCVCVCVSERARLRARVTILQVVGCGAFEYCYNAFTSLVRFFRFVFGLKMAATCIPDHRISAYSKTLVPKQTPKSPLFRSCIGRRHDDREEISSTLLLMRTTSTPELRGCGVFFCRSISKLCAHRRVITHRLSQTRLP